jgi:uncharacterized membrane protein
MHPEYSDAPESPDSRINWSIYTLALASFCLIGGLLAPWGILPALSGGWWFGIAVALGVAVAIVVNLARPRYEKTTGRWRAFYDFLLKQMPPPD